MKGLLVHGCYDQSTFQTLASLGVEAFAFDLRARSANLVPFRTLMEILPSLPAPEAVLMFSEDSKETISSFLDLLKGTGKDFILEFRDVRSAEFYGSLGRPFTWYFNPAGDWMNILAQPHCEGVILPLKHQELYHHLPHLWTLIEENDLRLWLHAENFVEAEFFSGKKNIQASLDLSPEIQSSYRTVNQTQLRTMKLWRKLNESSSGQ